MEWYLKVLKNYAVFNGRARRKEYWMFTLFYIISYLILMLIEFLIGIPQVLTGIYSLALFAAVFGRYDSSLARYGKKRLVDSHLADSARRRHYFARIFVPGQSRHESIRSKSEGRCHLACVT